MKKTLYILLFAASLILTGCNAWLSVTPYDKIAEDDLLSSPEGFRKLLNGVYIEMNSDNLYGSTLTVEMIELMGGAYAVGTDNTVWGNYKDISSYKFGTEYWRERFNQTWDAAYALILNCNRILEKAPEHKNEFIGDEYNIIRGEALALRAMLHFDMLRLFGPVYSRHSTSLSIPYYSGYTNVPQDILPACDIAGKILSDLSDAKLLLMNDPIIKNGTMMTPSGNNSSDFLRYRALRLNYYAVTALLARAELYFGNKPAAFENATEVIKAVESGIFPFVDKSLVTGSPEDPDRIFASEVIFALSHSSRNKLFKDYFDQSRLPSYVFRMDNSLIDNLIYGGSLTGGSKDDYRYKVNWVATGANRYFHKYADKTNVGSIENTMIPMLRTGEMYLIAAEAQSDNLGSGISYVNQLRKNRGVANLNTLNQDLLIYEYIRELYGEGQLFFLYKRLFHSVIFSASETSNPEPSDEIFTVPLPDTETENRQ